MLRSNGSRPTASGDQPARPRPRRRRQPPRGVPAFSGQVIAAGAGRRTRLATTGAAPEESSRGKSSRRAALVAAGTAFLQCARNYPNLFHLIGGSRINAEGEFPTLESAIIEALQVFAVGFAGTGMAPAIVVERTAVFVASLQGVITQILHHRLKVAPPKQKAFIADTCRMLIKGLS